MNVGPHPGWQRHPNTRPTTPPPYLTSFQRRFLGHNAPPKDFFLDCGVVGGEGGSPQGLPAQPCQRPLPWRTCRSGSAASSPPTGSRTHNPHCVPPLTAGPPLGTQVGFRSLAADRHSASAAVSRPPPPLAGHCRSPSVRGGSPGNGRLQHWSWPPRGVCCGGQNRALRRNPQR